MNILVIDTASKLEIIAACSGIRSAEASEFVKTSHSPAVLDNVDRCLKKLGIEAKDIDLIGVGIGPGSFTGIRIAVSTCRMLSQVLGKPLVGIKTQLLYAAAVDALENDNILIAFDAKNYRVFGALYRKSDDSLQPREIIPPGDYPLTMLLDAIDASRTTHMAGSGVEQYRQVIEAAVGDKVILTEFIPRGGILCDLILHTFEERPEAWTDYNKIVPFYTRKSYAEVALGSK